MSEISSGLVAVAWSYSIATHLNTNGEYCGWEKRLGRIEPNVPSKSLRKVEPLVRLSDAEAIIAQKDAEILEQCRINGIGAEREAALLGQIERQSAALKLAKEALADVMEWCVCQDSNFYKPCEEALAAIDALGELK